jgi:hypothetical protein
VWHTAHDEIRGETADDMYGTIFGTIRASKTRERRRPVLAHRL